MKRSLSAYKGFVFAVLASTAVALSGCGGGGGGGGSVPAPPAPAPTATPITGSVPIGTLDLLHPASSTAINLTSTTPAGPTVDVRDAAAIAVGPSTDVGMPSFSDTQQHAFKGGLAVRSTGSTHRTAQDVAVNSPYDLTYFGGPVLGSAVQHNLFINCVASCRDAKGFWPGWFLSELNQDQYLSLAYQYRTSPGVTLGSPVGAYTKGVGADLTATYASPRPGSSNPYFGELAIWLQVLNAAGPPGRASPTLGGGGLGNIYHVFLPQGVDTCFESPPGQPTTSCYSPDNFSTFVFCAYHGAFTATSGNQRQTYLYTVEPHQDVPGCRNNVGNRSLPNAVGPTDAADPGYSTLTHELFETITDPLLNAWFNGLTGNEIGDLCASFDNFVNIHGAPYVLQSEYSNINHLCVSANLTGTSSADLSVRRSH